MRFRYTETVPVPGSQPYVDDEIYEVTDLVDAFSILEDAGDRVVTCAYFEPGQADDRPRFAYLAYQEGEPMIPAYAETEWNVAEWLEGAVGRRYRETLDDGRVVWGERVE